MKVADPEDAHILLQHRILEFFRMGGFLHLQELDSEQKKLKSEKSDDYDDEYDDWDFDDPFATEPTKDNEFDKHVEI